MYTPGLIATLLRESDYIPPEETIDIHTAIKQLDELDRVFAMHILSGYSLRSAARKIGCPNNFSRRFRRVCRLISNYLNGEVAA